MTQFKIEVSGITRKEYFEACRINGQNLYKLLAVSMVFICGIIILFTGNTRPAAFLWPVGLYAAVVVGYELLTRLGYKDQLAVVDPPIVYEFGADGWTVKKEGKTVATVAWKATPRLKKTKNCLFLFNDDVNSNLLPLRLLTEGQVNSLQNWYKLSRLNAKEYQKQQDRLARKKFKEDHPGLRLGRTGPAWGPWSRKRRK